MPFYFSLQRTNWLKDNHGEAPESSLCLSLNNLLCAKCCTSVATQIYFWQKKGCKYIIILKSNLNTVRIYKSDKFTTPISFSSVQSLSCVWLFATPWIAAPQASLSITNSQSSPKLMSIESVMLSSHLILCRPLLLLPPIPPSIRVFSSDSTLHMRWPKYWSFSFSISPPNEHPGLISFRMDWLDLLAVQGILKSLLQHHGSKASILQCSAFLTVQG